jgi:hypothetical protein
MWGVTFGRDGRFSRNTSGGSGSGMTGELGGSGVNVGTIYTDKGSATSVGGPNFGGGSVSKREDKGDRAGTYSINGYTLELRYENGTVRRLPFFLSSANNPKIWFEGSLLMPAKAAK